MKSHAPRFAPALTWIFPTLLFVSAVLLVVLAPHAVVFLFEDDSFFYLKTAENIRRGAGSTFDGLNPTNGYHPLYMLWLVGVAFFRPLQGLPGLHSVFVADLLLTAVAFVFIDLTLKALRLSTGLRLPALAGLAGLVGFTHAGMEVKLLLPLAWGLIWLALRPGNGTRRAAGLGCVGALVVLARVDALPFVVLVLAAHGLAARPEWRARLRYGVGLFVPLVTAVVAYAAYNWLVFAHPASISSRLKMHWPGAFASGWPLLAGEATWMRLGFCLLAAGGYLLFWYARDRKQRPAGRPHVLLALNVSNLAYSLILFLFSAWEPRAWYFALPLSLAYITAVYLAAQMGQSGRGRHLPGLVCAGLALAAAGHTPLLYRQHRAAFSDGIALALWIKENVPPGKRIFQVDEAGMTGYFSERAVINGDGLINSWEYQAYLRAGALRDYLARYGVDYVVWDEYAPEERIVIPVPLWDTRQRLLSFARPPQPVARFADHVLLAARPADLVVAECDLVITAAGWRQPVQQIVCPEEE